MADQIVPSPSRLREILRYEPDTGKIFWLERCISEFQNSGQWKSWNSRFSGKEAFYARHPKGYLKGSTPGRVHLLSHRVAWAIHMVEWPDAQIDHINCNKTDNRIANLRLASPSGNMHNVGKRTNNTSGRKGVSFDKGRGKWVASICINWEKMHLGYFEDVESAHRAYSEAAEKYHGQFARTS